MMFNTLSLVGPFEWAVIAVLGLLIGSFLNVVIHRLPRMLKQQWHEDACQVLQVTVESKPAPRKPYHLAWPGSQCPHCGHTLSWFENIPLFSFLWLKGRCRHCHGAIAWQYPMVEALGLLAAVCAYALHGWSAQALVVFVFICTLICLAWIDGQTQLLPDALTLTLMWLGLIAAERQWISTPLAEALWGAVLGYVVLYAINAAFTWIKGQAGMGHGDFKLLAALGAWWGWQALPSLVLVASTLGLCLVVFSVQIFQKKTTDPIPFGPALALSGLLPLFWPAPTDRLLQMFA